MGGFKRLVRLRSSQKAMGSCAAQCKMLLFCANTVVRESVKFELARLKKEERRRRRRRRKPILVVWRLFGSVLSQRLFTTLGVFWARKTRIVSCLFAARSISFYCVSVVSLHIESTDSMIMFELGLAYRDSDYTAVIAIMP